MTELTVGYVAGFIALGVFIAHVFSPTAINLILAGVLGDKETAATWSLAGRSLQSSYWPDILRSDTARFHGVRSTISYLSVGKTILGILITIAGIVTPLGLYDDFEAAGVVYPTFEYAPDTTPFGIATLPRSNASFNRVCYYGTAPLNAPGPCPYSDDGVVVSWNGTTLSFDYPDGYNTSIATVLHDIYSSGTRFESSTISNYFDIQWRQYGTEPGRQAGLSFNDGSPMLAGRYQPILPLYIEHGIHLVEGLIVDTMVGGLGFRNHTIPAGLQYGASWSEDILFIEPETRCVDTNLTFEFTLEPNASVQIVTGSPFSEFVLVDKGGFVNLNQSYPMYDHAHAQDNPDLQARAYKAAYLFNAWLMAYMNITSIRPAFQYVSSRYDQRFPLPAADSSNYLAPSLSGFLPKWVLPDTLGSAGTGSNASYYSNPHNVTNKDFTDISTVCSGAAPIDIANITDIHVSCGLLRGPPRPLSGGSPLVFAPGSKWTSSLFTCASAVKATIKTVSFQLNGNSGLSNLSATSITPKSYPSTAAMPYWGVEVSGMALDQIQPLWGLLSSSYAKANYPNVSVVQKPELYLTGAAATAAPVAFGGQSFSSFDNVPASDFWFLAMNTLYIRLGGSLLPGVLPDYMASSSLAALARWQDQASDQDGAAAMLDVIWTDIAAPSVVGTKGVSAGQPPGQSAVRVAVAPVVHRVKYRIVFAIPAFVVAALLLVLLGATIGMTLLRRASAAAVEANLQRTSPGRVLAMLTGAAGAGEFAVGSREWSHAYGRTEVDLAEPVPDLDPLQMHEESEQEAQGLQWGH